MRNGLYSYADTAGNIHQVNLLQIAGSGNGALASGVRPFATTVDPMIAKPPTRRLLPSSSGAALVSNSRAITTTTPAHVELSSHSGDGFAETSIPARIDYNISPKAPSLVRV
jgi:hypothetical protein